MREKLIGLLKEAMVLSDGICRIVGNTQAVAIGHYLFAHGVTIPVRCEECRYNEDCIRRIQFWGRDSVLELNTSEYHPIDSCSYGERRTDDERAG